MIIDQQQRRHVITVTVEGFESLLVVDLRFKQLTSVKSQGVIFLCSLSLNLFGSQKVRHAPTSQVVLLHWLLCDLLAALLDHAASVDTDVLIHHFKLFFTYPVEMVDVLLRQHAVVPVALGTVAFTARQLDWICDLSELDLWGAEEVGIFVCEGLLKVVVKVVKTYRLLARASGKHPARHVELLTGAM